MQRQLQGRMWGRGQEQDVIFYPFSKASALEANLQRKVLFLPRKWIKLKHLNSVSANLHRWQCMHSPQHSLHLGLSESCQFLFTRALMNSVVLKSMKGTSAQPVIHSKIPPTSPSQNSFFCCQCHCLIPEGINDPSQKMNAISDGETVFKGGYTGSLVYCYVLLYSYHPIHSPSVQVWITHGCSTAAHESNRNPGRAETHWPHKNCIKEK